MSDFAPIDLPPPAGTTRLPHLAVVDARGADTVTFLQGQLSNDLAGAGASRACLAGYCNPKGRLLALPLVLTLADGGLRLIVERGLVEGLLQRLRMFVMRADVTFSPRDDLVCLGLTGAADGGEAPAHGVAALSGPMPGDVLEVVGGADGSDGAQLCRWHDVPADGPGEASARRRYLIVVAGDAVPADAGADGERAWRLGDIAAGLPRIVAATREAFVPQMVNLQLVDGLSFRKGCYPGQEIVARMQYLGKLKRHMRRFHVAGGDAPPVEPGTTLAAGDDADGGTVVDAVRTSAGTELLAVVRIATDPASLRVGEAALEPRPLPYALGDEAPTASPAAAPADTGGRA